MCNSGAASESLVYSYKKSFNGFAAKLSEEEMQKIAIKIQIKSKAIENILSECFRTLLIICKSCNNISGMEGIVSIFPSNEKKLHTTRSWDFMGFTKKVARRSVESDVIVGVIDTGIWPESDSFKDDGFGPPPKKWRGICQSPANFTCNNKIIGARYYVGGRGNVSEGQFDSPRDSEGHGTHTASTAAGALVSRTSLLGLARGTARGAVPSARIAVYKVCWSDYCSDVDILAAFDDAIDDGVDILSVSLGGDPTEYFSDSIAIGSFHAMKKGILTSNSAGNSGPGPSTLSNFSPWSLTVAASTIDRRFVTKVKLGNGRTYEGVSINTFQLKNRTYPLVYGGNVPNTSAGYDSSMSRYCYTGTLNEGEVTGKIVLCDQLTDGVGPFVANALGTIMQDGGWSDFAYSFPLPATVVGLDLGSQVLEYINTTRNPTADILRSEEVRDLLAPFVVSFSSRGPHPLTKDILKPDISAPGVDILAAWSPVSPLSGYIGDKRVVSYNIISGTSMSCPHATGAAAYVKSFHPTWSPAAIKSALMTTAYRMSVSTNTDAEFAYGAGHINPVLAVNPGLVYDADEHDYVEMLCNQGYDTKKVRLITGDASDCSKYTRGLVRDLNYPSMALNVTGGKSFSSSFGRTVTNVGQAESIYTAIVSLPSGVVISVSPGVLKFKSVGEKQSFVVTVNGKIEDNLVLSAALVWEDGVRRVYVVYLGELPKGDFSAESLHYSMLEQVLGSGAASESLVYSYKKSFNGFAAKLSEEEMQKISSMEGIVSIFASNEKKLHTTRSWDFMGFTQKVARRAVESDVIVGVIDTGIWPESDSFKDDGFGPPPKRWRGICQSPANFTCNNKIIGARYYYEGGRGNVSEGEFDSPRDSEGHGTHTASTAAGALVRGTSLLGLARGTARGAVPSARIAVYKVCWSGGCSDVDILAAFDDAIDDGVDILSVSLGGYPTEYFSDSIAIGSFHAMKKGILTSNSAGNSGPGPSTLSNFSPWSLTVAASTIDRRFVTKVKLGNGRTYEGVSINTFQLKNRTYPLVYGGNVPNTSAGYDSSMSRYCYTGSLNEGEVTGKIVLCDQLTDGVGPFLANALGTIMQDGGWSDFAYSFPLPATFVGLDLGSQVLEYINTTRNPTADILRSEEVQDLLAPFVVSFSSRGPHPLTKDILKPDISAPGVDILAAWSPVSPLSGYIGDKRIVSYNIISGTSMSCPHATGAAAYVKSFHPTWSPAAIKSALMTTAFRMSVSTNTDAEFAYGAGHINPVLAVNPGLVYDADEHDYVEMLCNQGYDTKKVRLITGDASDCSKYTRGLVRDLNYPSMALNVTGGKSFSSSFGRTVTNVGQAESIYTATVSVPSGVVISVNPGVLKFKSVGEKQSFVVTVNGKIEDNLVLSAALVWEDGVRRVRSPIVVYSRQ
ncbi:cucumisin-like protein [Cinnamomum micranthum f. kanehirae]|uniref:Cucumisin-like protein n=1 Tax=Cinnamomum micranthum f. kanehirae TaxID=337451 RepID=A0A3S3MGH3_9MAGN|nr:cucumisin-like protein [Cinnamomum micranthum f. kanehirae]